jgi:hypothetical protein
VPAVAEPASVEAAACSCPAASYRPVGVNTRGPPSPSARAKAPRSINESFSF